MEKRVARNNCFENLKLITNKKQLDLQLSKLVYNRIKPFKYIGVYSPIKYEPIIEYDQNFILCYPKVFGKEMRYYIPTKGFTKSSFGIDEPISDGLDEIIPDIIIAPCVGYFNNYRLGYGGGYYDRYLSKHNVRTIGIAYEVTKLDDLNVNDFDIELDEILKV